jgi:hypothetical protein
MQQYSGQNIRDKLASLMRESFERGYKYEVCGAVCACNSSSLGPRQTLVQLTPTLPFVFQAPDRKGELLDVATGVLEVFSVSLPYGVGVAFGLLKLALEYKDVAADVKELRMEVLRAAVDLLVQTELGRANSPANSTINYSQYQRALCDAINLCCTAKKSVAENRSA